MNRFTIFRPDNAFDDAMNAVCNKEPQVFVLLRALEASLVSQHQELV